MELSERKKQILKAIIGDYIRTAEPVGSKALTEGHELPFSSATIRNEMSELEDMGYFCVDNKDSAPGHLVFNRSVTLKDSFKV